LCLLELFFLYIFLSFFLAAGLYTIRLTTKVNDGGFGQKMTEVCKLLKAHLDFNIDVRTLRRYKNYAMFYERFPR
jgi:hypothetical protein